MKKTEWRLVPVEPTEEMDAAGTIVTCAPDGAWAVNDVWRVMLYAAPRVEVAKAPADETLPPLPPIPPNECLTYNEIRYVAGYPIEFIHKYATDYARAAVASCRREQAAASAKEPQATDSSLRKSA